VAGVGGAIEAAIGLCVIAAGAHYAVHDSTRAMPVQVRLAFLALLVLGLAPGMWWVHWSQLVGTSAMVLVGYCPLVRMLALLPWNRAEPLTRAFAWRTFAAAPAGGLLVPPRSVSRPCAALGGC
jgi:hypothetical protein